MGMPGFGDLVTWSGYGSAVRGETHCECCGRYVGRHGISVGAIGPFDVVQCRECYEEGEDSEHEVSRSKVVTARKARFVGKGYEIRPGDRVRVTNGFTYRKNGPRTGYFRHYTRVAKGPGWAGEEC